MSAPKSKRSRHVRKLVSFTAGEWEVVERRMEMAGAKSWERFARDAILESQIRVTRAAFDPSQVRAELSRIGNNINQIARQVNVEEVVTFEEMRAARMLLKEIQEVISRAVSEARGSGT